LSEYHLEAGVASLHCSPRLMRKRNGPKSWSFTTCFTD
jgi:hypothetical protein